MAMDSSVFPFAHIALTAAITAGLALLLLVALRARFKALSFADCLLVVVALRARFKVLSFADCLLVALVVGCSVLVWRSAGNTGALNNDPIPAVSPNDVLCPLVTYLFVGWYAAFRRPVDAVRFEQARVLLTLVSFLVNVVTI